MGTGKMHLFCLDDVSGAAVGDVAQHDASTYAVGIANPAHLMHPPVQ